ncbi:hypothetical protein CM15mP43_10640 [bacterium]|nr:MAG: hypothetical protein CM15mP43_10640 [bacterium]
MNFRESSLTARGRALTNILELSENEKVRSYISLKNFDQDKFF